MRPSIAESIRLTKKLATLATRLRSPLLAASFSRPARYASATRSYASCEKSNVTLTLMPSPINCWMAGMPSPVAGTLIITFGRATAFHNRRASSRVPCVSCARVGETSRLT